MTKTLLGLAAATIAGAAIIAATTTTAAQDTNPRFGRWKLVSEAPAPQSNIMTYGPWGDGGMSITIDSVNRNGEANQWGYNTMFDENFLPVEGQEGQTAAVRMITERTAEITYKQGDTITRVLTNVLSPDGNTLGIIYMNYGRDGRPDRVSFATYERIQE